jgi:hypothetical protein
MSTLLYQLTVIDRKGKVLVEEIHTSSAILAAKLPLIKQEAENLQRKLINELQESNNEKN